jgi:hypothetical protein
MESGGSLLHSKELATYPYSKPKTIRPIPQYHSFKIHFNIILWEIGTGQQVAQLHDS